MGISSQGPSDPAIDRAMGMRPFVFEFKGLLRRLLPDASQSISKFPSVRSQRGHILLRILWVRLRDVAIPDRIVQSSICLVGGRLRRNRPASPMLCKKCGAQISDRAVICVNCGVSTEAGQSRAGPGQKSAALRMVIPIGRSGYAIAAGYIGLFSVLVIPAPFAILFGVLALKDIKRHPDKFGKGRAWFGIIIGSLVILSILVAVIGGAFVARKHG
jgi:hypothetical protein